MDCQPSGVSIAPQGSGRWITAAARRLAAAAALLAALVAGCSTSVPFDYPRDSSSAIPLGDTHLGRYVQDWNREHGGLSAFYMLDDGTDALGARLRLIEKAEHSIDAQYFILNDDTAGRLFARALLEAADRGVRVRLLIDDTVAFRGIDRELALIDHHPNIEIRTFNPISRDGVVGLNFVASFQRANRRMHNKSFTVDSAATIVGGRNIGDEYYRISEGEFIDLDILGFGSVAAEVAETFDLFWNDELALPIAAFGIETSDAQLAQARRELEEFLEGEGARIYGQAISTSYLNDLIEGRIPPIVAPHIVVTDSPKKFQGLPEGELDALAVELGRAIEEAKEEVIVITPYLVPGREGMEFFGALSQRGVRVVFVTNSLASTDHIAVHSGYVTYRKAILEAGMGLYELKADSLAVTQPDTYDSSKSVALHTKAIIIDRETFFIGSLNVDPRSIDINSEVGVFLYSTEAATEAAEDLVQDLPRFAYRVALDDNGEVVWYYEGGDKVVTKNSEPDAGIGRAFGSDFMGIFPLEKQL